MFEVKTALKMFFEELDFFQLFFTSYFSEKHMFKEAGVKLDLPHID